MKRLLLSFFIISLAFNIDASVSNQDFLKNFHDYLKQFEITLQESYSTQNRNTQSDNTKKQVTLIAQQCRNFLNTNNCTTLEQAKQLCVDTDSDTMSQTIAEIAATQYLICDLKRHIDEVDSRIDAGIQRLNTTRKIVSIEVSPSHYTAAMATALKKVDTALINYESFKKQLARVHTIIETMISSINNINSTIDEYEKVASYILLFPKSCDQLAQIIDILEQAQKTVTNK